jgi:hypothetical protein
MSAKYVNDSIQTSNRQKPQDQEKEKEKEKEQKKEQEQQQHQIKQFNEFAHKIRCSSCGEDIVINWITKIVFTHLSEVVTDKEAFHIQDKNQYEDAIKALFSQSNVNHILLCLYTALMKLIEGNINNQKNNQKLFVTDKKVELLHNILAYGPFLTYRLFYPALNGLSWKVGPEGITAINRSDNTLPLRREALVTSNAPFYLLDTANEMIFYQSIAHSMQHDINIDDDKDKEEIGFSHQEDKNSIQFLDYMITRLYEHPFVPRIIVSSAGTASAVYFASQFAADNSSNHYTISYDDFCMFILDILLSSKS